MGDMTTHELVRTLLCSKSPVCIVSTSMFRKLNDVVPHVYVNHLTLTCLIFVKLKSISLYLCNDVVVSTVITSVYYTYNLMSDIYLILASGNRRM